MALIGFSISAEASTPKLVSAVSRKLHGSVTYDIPITSDGTAIESRTPAGVQVVYTFDQPVSAGTVAVTGGVATLSGNPVFAGNTLTATLNTANNAQSITLTASNVAAADGTGTLSSAAVSFRLLQGDVNGNGLITGSDVNLCKAQVGQPVTGFNFRCDINANGVITGSDVNLIKTKVGGSSVTGGATNTPPTIGTIVDQSAVSNTPSVPVGFAINDAESDPNSLAIAGVSSNTTLVPTANITFGGSGTSRTISITPASGQTGTCIITVTVGDGMTTANTTFNLKVTAASTLYIATLTPEDGANSTGSGTATLLLSGDQTQAVLHFAYSNLSTPEVAEHVHGPAGPTQTGGIIFDIDAAVKQADGSYIWVFGPSGNLPRRIW